MASSLPNRNAYSRTNSHSLSIGSGSYNPSHRVTRRKSTTLNATTSAAAITAAINIDANGEIESSRNRRKSAIPLTSRGSYPSPPGSLPQHTSGNSYAGKGSGSLADADQKINSKAGRVRRASEASALIKKKTAGAPGDLKCETCGKGYKHSSCLTKHLLVFATYPPCLLPLPLLTPSLLQLGTHSRMATYFQVANLKASASPAARGCFCAHGHEYRPTFR